MLTLCAAPELLFWYLPTEELVLVFSPSHVPLTLQPPVIVLARSRKKKIRQIYCFPQAHSFWTRGMSSKQCNSLQMLFAFHFIIACHAMFFESLLIYYLFHFFHFPFFCMLFLLFLPFLQSSVPVCRHNGDDRTSSSRLVSHSCLSYFSALLSGKTSLGRGRKKKKKKENAVFKGKPHFKWTDLINISSFLRLESLSSLVISVVSFITSCPGSRPALIPKRSRNDTRERGAQREQVTFFSTLDYWGHRFGL